MNKLVVLTFVMSLSHMVKAQVQCGELFSGKAERGSVQNGVKVKVTGKSSDVNSIESIAYDSLMGLKELAFVDQMKHTEMVAQLQAQNKSYYMMTHEQQRAEEMKAGIKYNGYYSQFKMVDGKLVVSAYSDMISVKVLNDSAYELTFEKSLVHKVGSSSAASVLFKALTVAKEMGRETASQMTFETKEIGRYDGNGQKTEYIKKHNMTVLNDYIIRINKITIKDGAGPDMVITETIYNQGNEPIDTASFGVHRKYVIEYVDATK